ncbi:hypothetical protein [Mycobacterium sp. C31M]
MSGEQLFGGFGDAGWDHAPWEHEPHFSAEELSILFDPTLTPSEAAQLVGCVERDVVRLRHIA